MKNFIAGLMLHAVWAACPAVAQSVFAPGIQFTEEVILQDLPASTAVAFTPDNSKIFIATKNGIVRVARTSTNTLVTTPFIDISAMVNRSTDRGLLAIAVDPAFPTRPYIYLSFVFNPPGVSTNDRNPKATRLVRVTADAAFDYERAVSTNPMLTLVGTASTQANLAPALDPAVQLPTPQPASCMDGLIMGGDVFPPIDSDDPDPKTTNAPIEDCVPADGLSHTAGMILFDRTGPSPSLYASFGDGSSYDTANRPALRALLKDSLAGKIVRINPDTGDGVPGNPFFDPDAPRSNRSRIWSYGLRNPFRFALHPVSGQIFLGDVGSSRWEEINSGKSANFGWPCFEGGVAAGSGSEGADTTNLQSSSYYNFSRTRSFCARHYELQRLGRGYLTRSIFSYAHPLNEQGQDLGAAITGVAFYSGASYPAEFRNSLFYSDFALRHIRYLTFDQAGVPTAHDFAVENAASKFGVVQLLENPVDKNIFALYLDTVTNKSTLRRIRYVGGNTPPRVQISATPVLGSVPLNVTFRSDGTNDPDGQPLLYQWDFGDGNGSSDEHPTHTYENVGIYTARLTVTEGTTPPGLSSTGSVTIRTGSSPPQAFISTPTLGSLYNIGDTIQYSGGAAYNPEPGAPAVQLDWTVLQHHNFHSHIVQESSGESGSFVATEHADNTFYEICLFAEAGEGLRDQQCREIRPRTTDYTIASSPPGASVSYVDEGSILLAPHITKPIVGSVQTVVASSFFSGRSFIRWSDGVQSAERTYTVGVTPQTLTAVYENLPPNVRVLTVPASGIAPLNVHFDASGSSDPEGGPLVFSWTFPDGSTATGPVVDKSFPIPGTYQVQAFAEDRTGVMGSTQVTVTVTDPSLTPPPNESPVTEPTPVPRAPTATPTETPTGSVAVQVPKGKISPLGSGTAACGSTVRPCAFAGPQKFSVLGILRKPAVIQGVSITAAISRQVGKKWKVVLNKPATFTKGTGFKAQISTKKLKVPGNYRVRFLIGREGATAIRRTGFQYFRIR